MPAAPAPGAALKVALDGEPLLGARTGIGRFALHLAETLASVGGEEGIDPVVYAVTWRMRSELARRLPRGVPLVGRPMPARPVRAAWARGVDLPVEWFTGRLDVVHGTNFVVPPARRAARVVSVHDLSTLRFPELCHPATLCFPDMIRRAVAGGAWVHTLSDFVADEVVASLGVDRARVRTVHLGVPPVGPAMPAGPEVRTEMRFDRYVLAVGTVEPRKDYPGLVRAFDRVAALHPGVGLVVAGAPGWGSEAFEEAVSASAARARIVQTGFVDDAELARLLRGAAVLAYPSLYEGFGFPPLQAMSVGVPVVATAAGAVPEVVGDAALTVAPGDVEALASALASVLDDSDVADRLVAAGRERAAGYTWERCARAMSSLYRDAHAARR